MYKCDPCGKTFTGQVSLDQHLVSDKHKKKYLTWALSNKQDGSIVVSADEVTSSDSNCSSGFRCEVCNMSFISLESFQNHSVSPSHALKIMMKHSGNSAISNGGLVSSNIFNNPESNDTKNKTESIDEEEILPELNDCSRSRYLPYGNCDICKKVLTGPEQYRQHFESENHKKQVRLQNNLATGIINLAVLACEVCKKSFSGEVSYNQHMVSDKHKKKVQSFENEQKYLSQASVKMVENVGEKAEDNKPWFCKICNRQCSGFFPFQQHITGSIHFKNIKRLEEQKKLYKTQDNMKADVQVNNSNYGKVLEKPADVSVLVSDNCQKKENDLIFPENINDLKIVSVDEIEKSCKIFLPDEKIHFEELGNNNEDSSNENCVSHQSESKESSEIFQESNESVFDNISDKKFDGLEVKSDIYQVCKICDVQLLDKDNAAQHYESMEHFKRRWGSVSPTLQR